jgi:hypothetical protein
MATYIPGDSPYVPDINPFQLDFSMMQNTLGTKQARYDQNFNQVQGMYNSLANAALTQEDNQVARDSYLKTAQQQLSNLASVDLSMDKNRISAENVFTPFYEDREIIKDMTLTQRNTKALQTAYAWRDSKDKEQRDQFNSLAVEYIANGVEKLRTSKRGTGEIFNLEAREFVPFRNIHKELFEGAKEAGYDVEYTQQNGGHIVTLKNGAKTKEQFYNFAKDFMGNRYDGQNHVVATVSYERDMKTLRNNNPTATDAELKDQYVDLQFGRYKQASELAVTNYEKGLTGLNSELKLLKEEYADKKFAEGSPIHQRLIMLQNGIAKTEEALKNAQHNAAQFDTPTEEAYLTKKKDIFDDPIAYNINYLKETQASNWAQVASARTSEKWATDGVWKEQIAFDKWKWEQENENRKFEIEQRNKYPDNNGDGLNDNKQFKNGIFQGAAQGGQITEVGVDSTGQPIYQDASGRKMTKADKDWIELQQAKYRGNATNMVTKENMYDVVQGYKASLAANVENSLYSSDGVSRILTKLTNLSTNDEKKVSHTDVMNGLKALEQLKRGTASAAKPEDSKSLWKLTRALEEQLEMPMKPMSESGPKYFENLMIAYATKHFSTKNEDATFSYNPEDQQIFRSLLGGEAAQRELIHIEENEKRAKNELIKNNPEYKKIVNDKGEFITTKDIEKEFEGLKIQTGLNSTDLQEVDPAFAARMFNQNQDMRVHSQVRLKNGNWTPLIGHGLNGSFIDKFRSLQGKYEHVPNRDELAAAAKKQVAEKFAPAHIKDGKLGHILEFAIDGKSSTNERGIALINEIVQPGNRGEIYFGEEPIGKGSNELIQTLTKMGTGLENLLEGGAQVYTTGPNGRPMIAFTIKNGLSSDHTLKKYEGKPIMMEVAANATGPELKALTQSSDFFVFGKLLRDENVKSSPVMNAGGYNYEATFDKGRNEVRVAINRKEFIPGKDGADGKYEPKNDIISFSLNNMTVDQVMETINNGFFNHMSSNAANQERHKRQVEAIQKASEQSGTGPKMLSWDDVVKPK